jgi:hypothetical protein
MLKHCLVLALAFFFVGCGKVSPLISGVDIPPSNNPVTQPTVNSNDGTSSVPAPEVHVFSAPIVAVRGPVTQAVTSMTVAPGN